MSAYDYRDEYDGYRENTMRMAMRRIGWSFVE